MGGFTEKPSHLLGGVVVGNHMHRDAQIAEAHENIEGFADAQMRLTSTIHQKRCMNTETK